MDALDPNFPAMPPTQDELPCDDGEPMESEKHRAQMNLLIESLRLHLHDRPDIYIGGNMALYYSVVQARRNDFRAPDFFVVLDAIVGRERKSWVVWEENSRTPDVVIELLSESTESTDRGRKMQVYAGLKVKEYYLFDPGTNRLEAYHLDDNRLGFHRVAPRPDGDYPCSILGLRLGVAEGTYIGLTTPWLRWKAPDGTILPTGAEQADGERARADGERARADGERARADGERARADAIARRADRLAARLRALGEDPDA